MSRQTIDHLSVDCIEAAADGRGPGSSIPGRWLSVVDVEIPGSAYRLITVHQVAEPAALPSVEVLHDQPFSPIRPGGKIRVVAQELV